MENATDALIMAGSVLLLIIALTISISSFSNLKTQVDEIVGETEQLQFVKDTEGGYLNYLKSSNDTDVRTVGVETIISSLRRLQKEQYTIYICLNPTTTNLINLPEDLKLKGQELSEVKQKFNTNEVIKLSLSKSGNKYIEDDKVINTLYKELTDKNFKEYIGIYQYKTETGVSDANKETYKIITFVQTT